MRRAAEPVTWRGTKEQFDFFFNVTRAKRLKEGFYFMHLHHVEGKDQRFYYQPGGIILTPKYPCVWWGEARQLAYTFWLLMDKNLINFKSNADLTAFLIESFLMKHGDPFKYETIYDALKSSESKQTTKRLEADRLIIRVCSMT